MSVQTVIAVLGDSISAGTPGWDPDPVVRSQFGRNVEESQWQYWAARRHPQLEFRNYGVNRETTAQIADRLQSSVEAADWVVVAGGINDVVNRLPVAQAAETLHGMVRWCKAEGRGVLLADVLPWNNGYEGSTEEILRLNELIREIGHTENVRVMPFHATLEDPDNPRTMRPEWTADGNHPSVQGHRRLGEIAFTWP